MAEGMAYVLCLWVSSLLFSFFDHQQNWRAVLLSVRMDNALKSMIFNKALKLPEGVRGDDGTVGVGTWATTISSETAAVRQICTALMPLVCGK